MNAGTFRRHVEAVLAALCPARTLPRVLYYHSVHPEGEWSHTPAAFAAQMRLLKEWGYQVLTLAQAGDRLGQGALEAKTVVITFDDGYEDNYRYALPLLVEMGLRATFFVVSGLIGDTPTPSEKGNKLYPNLTMLSRRQLRELAGYGMEVGSHTRSHIHVRKSLDADPATVEAELRGSKEELESVLGAPVVSFAYPNGQKGAFSAATRAALQKGGYRFAATTMWGALTREADLLALPRIEIRYTDSLDVFAGKLEGRYDFMGPYCRLTVRSKRW